MHFTYLVYDYNDFFNPQGQLDPLPINLTGHYA